jgi:hypothetical protein
MEAARVQRILFHTFCAGATPMRVPLWDYEGRGLYESATDADRLGYLRVVESPAFETVPSGDGYAVVGDVRCGWSEFVGVPPAGPLTVTVGATAEEVG